jgi:hypothetical protein
VEAALESSCDAKSTSMAVESGVGELRPRTRAHSSVCVEDEFAKDPYRLSDVCAEDSTYLKAVALRNPDAND